MTPQALENRSVLGGRIFRGTVKMWIYTQGWGFILAEANVNFPPQVQSKIAQMQKETKDKGKKAGLEDSMFFFRKEDVQPGVQIVTKKSVQFQIYTDDKGAGACEVH